MDDEPKLLEREAYDFLGQDKLEESYALFKKAAQEYRKAGNSKQAAICYASAASCWCKKSGERTFYNAALSYEKAAIEALKSGDFEYASVLFKHAAINHERDGDFLDFSACFYKSKEAYRKFVILCLLGSKDVKNTAYKSITSFFKKILSAVLLTLSWLVWGHGEKPLRTFFAGISIIVVAAVFYTFGSLNQSGALFRPDFYQGFYFSVVTFTTVGYGDYTPIGLSKIVAIVEAICGLFILPISVIGLSRKYLRV